MLKRSESHLHFTLSVAAKLLPIFPAPASATGSTPSPGETGAPRIISNFLKISSLERHLKKTKTKKLTIRSTPVAVVVAEARRNGTLVAADEFADVESALNDALRTKKPTC